MHKESVIRHVKTILSCAQRNTGEQVSDTVCLQPWFTKTNK